MDDKLKGHLLLRQAMLDAHDKNMIIGSASGSHDINQLSTAMRNAYIDQPPSSVNTNTNLYAHGRPSQPATSHSTPIDTQRSSFYGHHLDTTPIERPHRNPTRLAGEANTQRSS